MATVIDKNLGYLFYRGSSQFGDGALDVALYEKPTQDHFDPERVHVVVGASLGVQSLDIHHPWRLGAQYRVCVGHIRILDRRQKMINVFSFGGQLRITAVASHTLCQFTSPAPFLELTDGNPITLMLASEIDILLAEQKARFNPRTTSDFDSKFVFIDPFRLYLCCLKLLEKKFLNAAYQTTTIQRRFRHQLGLEISRLKRENRWPAATETLADLMTAS